MGQRYLAFDPFVLDMTRRALLHGGVPVPLTPKAVEILAMLVERAGQLVSKDELLEALWPGEFVQESNLSQHIYLVRKALAAYDAADLIKTVPRRGYRFAGDVHASSELRSPQARAALVAPALKRVRTAPLFRFGTSLVTLMVLVIALAVGFGGIVTRPGLQPARASLDPRAERAYRIGRYYWQKRDTANLQRSLVAFREVIKLAPESPLGYSGASDAYLQLAILSSGTPAIKEQVRLTGQFAKEALRRGPGSAEAHSSYGLYLQFVRRDSLAAERELQRAIELDPTYASAHHWYGIAAMALGDSTTSVRELRTASELDPTSIPISAWLGYAYYYARRYDEAIAQLRQTLEMDQHHAYARLHLALALAARGRAPEAIAAFRRLPIDQFDPIEIEAWQAYAYAVQGQGRLALDEVARIVRAKKHDRVGGPSIAAVFLALGDRQEALDYLRLMQGLDDDSSIFPRYDPRIADLMPEMYPSKVH